VSRARAVLDTSALLARDRLLGVGLVITALSTAQVERAGELRESTSHLGLLLSDRCCLALALDTGLPVLTGDGTSAKADVGAVVVIR